MKVVKCQYCKRPIVAFQAPEPDDEVICHRCEDDREDSRRERAWELQHADEY